MTEVLDYATHTIVKDEMALALFGNRQLGNVNSKFGPETDEEVNDNQLYALRQLIGRQAVDMSQLVLMQPTGINGFTDLSVTSETVTDGFITTDPGIVLSGNPADCEMIVMYGKGEWTPVLGLIHVSRRIADKRGHILALEYLCENYGLSPDTTRLMFSPSIRAESYKFPEIDEQQKDDPAWAPYINLDSEKGLWHIDVHGKVRAELCAQGITNENIVYESTVDVGSDPNYFSHRQYVESGQSRGRNAVMAKLKTADL